ncbi:anti-phage-associated DUF1156 domain-containing protein [Rhizobium anhuiense]|uniref:anti-phage-associated DUF1156 domain-containing protein n=1 Tax=Rhizobium anhuiense TaxID=1184720 RepID=UPI0015CF6E2C|nr:anti-phage-associated DUF1156 domain-containing protein [Rhizobium anhuiense]
MTALATANKEANKGLVPFSMKDAPSFIEAEFPVGRISAEAYKERKAGSGQTLTALGSYWKGRKPLILVRAVVLGCLLPATEDPAGDLAIFLKLMGMDDAAMVRRLKPVSPKDIDTTWPDRVALVSIDDGKPRWRSDIDRETRDRLICRWLLDLPYDARLKYCLRPEECDEAHLLAGIWPEVNQHLGTNAGSIAELVDELGIARFGHRPKLADTFSGGGSIPFEAVRMGCDVYASDLSPIACMLTWGAFNIIGARAEKRAEIERAQREVAALVDAEITRLGIEHDKDGNRAKAYLYCLETRCPRTGWVVPMAPSWVISKTRNVVAKLVPDLVRKRYDIEIHAGVSSNEMAQAERGTVQGGRLVHPMNPERSGVEIRTIRGDHRDEQGVNRNRLRLWEKTDFVPRSDDIWQERLYAIQWITKASLGKGRQETYFAGATEDDLARERQVEAIVAENLSRWQDLGLVPDMAIAPGANTTQPIWERGWTHWHHLFNARNLLGITILRESTPEDISAYLLPLLPIALDNASRLCGWNKGHPGSGEFATNVFNNQSFNTHLNFASRSVGHIASTMGLIEKTSACAGTLTVEAKPATAMCMKIDIGVTDPPYADAVNYHEITEFFIAWLRKNPPPPFDQWTWDSRRDLAIKGKDEGFRRDMVSAYAAMTRHMPDNGSQVVMFTHQDAGVWADLGSILWAAGLRVTAAWNIVTETESALKEGNYVQGTVCLVLRKRLKEANARRMEIEAEIEDAVRAQLDRLNALDEAWTAETLYTDGDLTLAAYAAALQVITSYSTIDRQPLDRDLYRKLAKGERTMIRDLVDYAAQVANGMLVPTDFPRDMWRDLRAPERFYVRMLDMEAKGSAKVADFQNFAKSFAFGDYTSVMASTTANAASLAGAADFKGGKLGGEGFFATQLRQVLFAVWKTLEKSDPKLGVITLRTEYAVDYWQRRQKLIALAAYVAAKTKHTRPEESAAAHELAEALKLDRV